MTLKLARRVFLGAAAAIGFSPFPQITFQPAAKPFEPEWPIIPEAGLLTCSPRFIRCFSCPRCDNVAHTNHPHASLLHARWVNGGLLGNCPTCWNKNIREPVFFNQSDIPQIDGPHVIRRFSRDEIYHKRCPTTGEIYTIWKIPQTVRDIVLRDEPAYMKMDMMSRMPASLILAIRTGQDYMLFPDNIVPPHEYEGVLEPASDYCNKLQECCRKIVGTSVIPKIPDERVRVVFQESYRSNDIAGEEP